jgi:hypothetical protein
MGTASSTSIWRDTDTTVLLPGGQVPFTLDVNTFYYVQYDVHDDTSITTVRSDSYEGPILLVGHSEGLVESPAAQQQFHLGNIWSPEAVLTVDEIHVEQYAL